MKVNIKSSYVYGLIFYSLLQSVSHGADDCRFNDLYHHGRTTFCLGRESANLRASRLHHLLDNHIVAGTKVLDLSSQANLDDSLLQKVVNETPHTATVVHLNLTRTNVTYDGIASLWRSKSRLGRIRDDEPIYERFYNLPVSVVAVEIGHTPALSQYIEFKAEEKILFPFPLLKDFEITYPNQIAMGFRDIMILDHGKRIS